MPQVIDFSRKIRSYILFNPSPKSHTLQWSGVQFTIPGRDQVRDDKSAKFSDGTWMTGTYVISDLYNAGDLSGLSLDVEETIKMMLGLVKREDGTYEATSGYAKFGIAFMPMDVSKEAYQSVRENSIRQWEAFRVEDAMATVASHEDKAVKWRAVGLTPPPPKADVEEAIAILTDARKRTEDGLASLRLETTSSDDDLELMAFAKSAAMELAGKVEEHDVEKQAKLAEKLLEDPKIRMRLLKKAKLRVRRVGYAEDTEESLQKEAAGS